ncbi:MAG: ABC transporter permease subunit [Euryarchaeota archaeon]|nr:ABC transporter permease subunit [Euryarchaeota archaeon]
MVTSKQMVEKFRDYRRSFIHNWRLFKESKIGLVGLAVLIFFSLMAVSAPFLGLKHPVDWMAPSTDILEVDKYFQVENLTGPVNHSVGYRIRPAALDAKADRVYAAYGNSVTAIRPNGISLWTYRATDASLITTTPIVQNIGNRVDPNRQEQRIAFGTLEGRLYVLRDNTAEGSASRPTGDNVYRTDPLGGAIMRNPAFYNNDTLGLYGDDRLFVTTESGMLYAFSLQYDYDPLTQVYSATSARLNQAWSVQVSNASLGAPVVSIRNMTVLVSDRVGKIYSYSIANGMPMWPEPYDAAEPVSSDLVLAKPSDGDVVFLATDLGRLHCVNVPDGTPYTSNWTGGMLLMKDLTTADEGPFNTPTTTSDGSEAYVTSRSGFFYAITIDSQTQKWTYDATEGGRVPGATFDSSAYYDTRYSKGVYAVSRVPGSPGDPTDDYSWLYRFTNDSLYSWRLQLPGAVYGGAVLYFDSDTSHLNPSVWTGTAASDGTGVVYSYSCTGSYLAPLPPTWVTNANNADAKFQPPKSGNYYIFGTDTQGRDVFSQTIWGSQIALMVGFSAAFFSIAIGIVIGLVSGYYGGKVDSVLMRFTDVILVLPGLPLLIILAALLSPSIWNIVLIIAIVGWGGIARVIRAEVLSLKERPFIDSARVSGASKARIMFRHIAPNVLPLAMLYMTFGVSGAILSEAALSFIGLGDPRTMSWGIMLQAVSNQNALANWWWLLPPGLCITLVCMAFFLIGRAFDQIVNPRLRRRR